MNKVNFYTQKRYRRIKQEEFSRCLRWFNKEDFYFFTKRPNSLSPGDIDVILKDSFVFTNEKNKPVGLFKFDSEFFATYYVFMGEFRFADKEYYSNSIGERLLFGYIYYVFFETNKFVKKIMFRVHAFDKATIDFLNSFNIRQEVCLKNQVYKFGKFNDLFIYSITREEYLEVNNLRM